MSKNRPFNIGDIVYITSGNAPREVLGYVGSQVRSRYVRYQDQGYHQHGRDELPLRNTSSFRLYDTPLTPDEQAGRTVKFPYPALDDEQFSEKVDTMSSTELYQTKEETPRFGTKLAVTSSGQIALEMKPTGEIVTFNSDDIEVVRPYTIRVAGLHTTPDAPKGSGHVQVAKDKNYKVGELLFGKLTGYSYFGFYTVMVVDTKNEHSIDASFQRVKLED